MAGSRRVAVITVPPPTRSATASQPPRLDPIANPSQTGAARDVRATHPVANNGRRHDAGFGGELTAATADDHERRATPRPDEWAALVTAAAT